MFSSFIITLYVTLQSSETVEEMQDEDIWLEDEDVVQDLLAFQDEDPGFQMPFEEPIEESHNEQPTGLKRNIFLVLMHLDILFLT